ncbi:UDP-glucose/GDP-mannose dehydrogenase family protein [Salinibacterium sp. ZJ77]|uniref:UDP-glucose dehydrogenase family protein n=1 Tax=Salinibacterium sp. ZJ77 TaxID=2708337 RepID=UPI0014217F87|nr:UDP-glucose/GDP-mannose dehydrogenase family protein [Salinibacterium sp. ZJ77]
MRISVFGVGYLGAVHAASMARLGHHVVGVDVDPGRIASLAAGEAPFFEPGFPELLSAGIESGRLRFTTDPEAARDAEVHFIAVGTPEAEGGAADLHYVRAAVAAVSEVLAPGAVVVGKSTVPVGTAQSLAPIIEAAGGLLVWNPEFLREGFAVQDTLAPDRLVYGIAAGHEDGVEALDAVYSEILSTGAPRIVTDLATAELVKVAANAFLATKISFINAMAEIAEVTGADVTQLADAIGYDARIGRRFLNAGVGFGGGCLPKDIRAFQARAAELGAAEALGFLAEVDRINLRRRTRVVELANEILGGVAGRRIAVLGLAFKPDSDDVRDSPALDIAARLRDAGALIRATDPKAVETARRRVPDLDYRDDADEALSDAELVILLTEWEQFRTLSPEHAGDLVAGRRIIDARNVLDRDRWRDAGWDYRALGRA